MKITSRKPFPFIFLFLACSGISPNSIAQAHSELLTTGWEFYKSDLASPWEAFRPLNLIPLPFWEHVNLPHTYNAYDAVDPDAPYYQGPAWYRTTIFPENPFKNGRTLLKFEGAGQKTEVYVFTQLAGSHIGGYDEFSVDITTLINSYLSKNNPPDGKIPIAIRCDNSRDAEMIPSNLSDFTLYGGLYRKVRLEYVPEVSIQSLKTDYTLSADFKVASLTISALLYNPELITKSAQITYVLRDSAGKTIQKLGPMPIHLVDSLFSSTLTIQYPQLWSPAKPILYKVEVQFEIDDIVSAQSCKIGFRSFEFKSKGPFYLNGERLLLRGTHRHEDHAGTGPAMNDEILRHEMQLMKDMGVNFIRLGHYQQSRSVLDLCDELGILVWEEIPWCRGGIGGETYKAQARRMLENMIIQHYNHPSVIIWGLGNENDWPGDFEVFDTSGIRDFMTELNTLAHSLDPQRKTAIRRCDFCKDIVDVYSPSIWAGWYRGFYTNYKNSSFEEAQKVECFFHAEWGADHHAGRHSQNPYLGILEKPNGEGVDERAGDFLLKGGDARVSRDGDWSETYACDLIDWHLKEQETMDWLSGSAYWPFKDFATPLRPENPIPYVNQKGVVQRDLRPKESYYVFQSYWTDKPMVHIYGHGWETRWGTIGEEKELKVYSNCPQVELFLNGKSLGIHERNAQDFPAAGLRWKAIFAEGENLVKAIAWNDKKQITDSISLNYQTKVWEKAAKLELSEIARTNDTVTIEARVYDYNGVFCPDARNRVTFSIAGEGKLLDNLGTSDGSRNMEMYNGRARIKIKLEGKAVAGVISEGLTADFVEL